MMKKTALIFSLLLLALPLVASEERVASPDGRLVVTVSDNGGKPTYSVAYDGVAFLAPSPLGLKADIGDFTAGLALTGFAQEAVADDYSVRRSIIARTRAFSPSRRTGSLPST